jgi:hypothetical protein
MDFSFDYGLKTRRKAQRRACAFDPDQLWAKRLALSHSEVSLARRMPYLAERIQLAGQIFVVVGYLP